MKKIKKFGTIALSTAVLATSIFATTAPINSVSAYTDKTDKIMTIEKLLSNYKCDENGKVSIPKAKAESGNVSTKIYALNSNEEIATTDVNDSLQFVPEYSAYRVEYSINGVVKSFVVNIELTKPVLSMKENDKVFLPSDTVKDYTLLIPYVDIKDENGDALVNANGQEYTDAELIKKTTIKIYAPDGTILSDTEADAGNPVGTVVESDKQFNETIKYLQFTPKVLGTYTIKYSFKTDSTTEATLTKEVKVKNALKTERDITFTLSSSLGTPVIGEDFALPKPVVKDNTNDIEDIESYTEIAVKCIKKDGTSVNVDVDGFTFKPVVEGDYIITYNVSDVYGNKAQVVNYQITNVSDKKAPYNVKLVDSYEFTDNDLDKLEDYSYKLQTRMGTSIDGDEATYLVIPAVYAEDNDPNISLTDLIVKRTIKSYSSSTEVKEIEESFNKTAKYKVEKAGTYTVTYTIYDKENGNMTEKSYQVIVTSNFADAEAPIITFDKAIPTSAKAGETIVFNKPTAVDYRDTNKSTGDTRIELKTYYYIDSDVDNKVLVGEYEGNSTKLAIKVPSDFAGQSITIVTYAIDDEGNTAKETHIVDIVLDNAPAEFVTIDDFGAGYTQGSIITLPGFEVSDNYIDSVSASIEVVNAQNERVLVSGLNRTKTATGNLILNGASFYAVTSGEYQIKYILRDGSNNVTVFTNTINVEKTIAPVMSLDKDLITAELGDEVDLNIFSVYDEGQLISPNKVVISGVSIDNNNVFKATDIGSYTATFTYSYDENGVNNEISKQVVINVNDTTKPVITFSGDVFDEVAYKPNTEISLPTPVVTDNSGDECDLQIKITRNGDEVTFDSINKKFTPTSEGTYVITYTATDLSGNTQEKAFNITVGDKTGPVIDLGDESVNAPSSMKVGSTLTLDTSKIVINDEYEKKVYSLNDDNVKITLRDNNGKVVENITKTENGYSWKLENVGSYTLTYRATDSNGNTTTITKNIEVSEETKPESKVGDTGMVLAIVAALAVLAGVIVFFFKPERKNKNKKSK